MRLRVQNLGPVREAELDLSKPLIVLTGPNNSGKTYLAWAAYSLPRLNSNSVEPPARLKAWVDELMEAADETLDVQSLLDIHDDFLHALEEALQKQLPEDFAAPRDRFTASRLTLVASAEEKKALLSRHPKYSLGFGGESVGFELRNQRVRLRRDASNQSLTKEATESARSHVVRAAMFMLTIDLLEHMELVAFPVERLAINLFARELAAQRTALVDDLLSDASEPADSTALRDKLQRRAGRYPLIIRDALQVAIRISAQADIGPFAYLADEIEAMMLGGTIKLNAFDEILFFPRQAPTLPLRLHESASVVKSLVSLVLYLRFEAREGQCLVIDEPELNLHPDNQRLIARILAKAVNRGLKIMMSTHSDYVIRELNNLLMLGQGNADKARALVQELGYQPEQILRGDQIAAYLVNDGACTRLDITETGFETKTIEDEIHKLNQDAQTIYFRLFED